MGTERIRLNQLQGFRSLKLIRDCPLDTFDTFEGKKYFSEKREVNK